MTIDKINSNLDLDSKLILSLNRVEKDISLEIINELLEKPDEYKKYILKLLNSQA
jgi:hypothetical protein